MAKLGKRTRAAREAFAGKSGLSIEEAVALVKGNAKAKFERCFFNWQLYQHMILVGFNKNDAKPLSYGRLYYLFFRVF